MSFEALHIKDEQLLWEKFLAGDRYAYECLYRKYIEALFSYGMCCTSDRELVKDCVQDVFVKIYTNRSNLNHTDNVRLYLFIALKNTLFNVFDKNNSLYQIDTVEPVFTVEYSIEDELIADELQQEQQDKINQILNMLTPRQKEVMYCRYVKGLSLNEICEIMQMNYQSVQNLIQRSIKRIHTAIVEKENYPLCIKMRSRYKG